MSCLCSNPFRRLLGPVAFAAALAFSTAGCKHHPTDEWSARHCFRATQRRRLAALGRAWGDRYRASPANAEAAINYAQALRGMDQRSQAAAVLEQASIQNPRHPGVRGAYGRALADAGNYQRALDVLKRAHTPDQPDWRILSIQGAVLDQMGRHNEVAKLLRDRLAHRAGRAFGSVQSRAVLRAIQGSGASRSSTLRRATAQGRADTSVQQNLAVVVGLQGRLPEAETTARARDRRGKPPPP